MKISSLLVKVLGSILFFSALVQAAPKYGPNTIPISKDHKALQKSDSPDYWALSPFYIYQQDGRSCSVATVTILMNGLRAKQELTQQDPLVTQASVLKKTNLFSWKKSVSMVGRGVTLDQLGEIITASLKAYGITGYKVDVVHAHANDSKSKTDFFEALAKNQKSAEDFMVINFDQKVLTGDPEGGGHISPIGAYDSDTQRVLILDTDREWYEPYWSPQEKVFEAMATQDSASSQTRGYIWVRK